MDDNPKAYNPLSPLRIQVSNMVNQTVATWVPKTVTEQIQELVNKGKYNNTADFVRCAVREKLERETEKAEVQQLEPKNTTVV